MFPAIICDQYLMTGLNMLSLEDHSGYLGSNLSHDWAGYISKKPT